MRDTEFSIFIIGFLLGLICIIVVGLSCGLKRETKQIYKTDMSVTTKVDTLVRFTAKDGTSCIGSVSQYRMLAPGDSLSCDW